MSIYLEAYEAHSIEQDTRKQRYEEQYHKEIDPKTERCVNIAENQKKSIPLTEEDILFFVNEIRFLYMKQLSDKVPYLKDHFKRVRYEAEYRYFIELYAKVLSDFRDLVKNVYWGMHPSLLGNKKKILSLKKKANELLEFHKNEIVLIEKIINEEEIELVEWEQDKITFLEIEYKVKKRKELSMDELEWLKSMGVFSVIEQMTTADLFFSHHFTRVRRNETIYKELEALKEGFKKHYKFIKYASNVSVYSFGNKENLERITREASKAHYGTVPMNNVLNRILAEIKENDSENKSQ